MREIRSGEYVWHRNVKSFYNYIYCTEKLTTRACLFLQIFKLLIALQELLNIIFADVLNTCNNGIIIPYLFRLKVRETLGSTQVLKENIKEFEALNIVMHFATK